MAAALQGLGGSSWHAFVADAADRAAAAPVAGPIPLAADTAALLVRAGGGRHARPGHAGGPGSHIRHSVPHANGNAPHELSPEERDAVNVRTLAGTIEAEAGGQSEAAKVAVGSVVHNRMLRNDKQMVTDVGHGFAHPIPPTPASLTIATGILHGTIKDPTNGATHFYTPERQPKAGEPIPRGKDGRGGPESVPGVVDRDGTPFMTLKPSWAADPDHEQRVVPSVPEHLFKFYMQKIDGRHRRVQ